MRNFHLSLVELFSVLNSPQRNLLISNPRPTLEFDAQTNATAHGTVRRLSISLSKGFSFLYIAVRIEIKEIKVSMANESQPKIEGMFGRSINSRTNSFDLTDTSRENTRQ